MYIFRPLTKKEIFEEEDIWKQFDTNIANTLDSGFDPTDTEPDSPSDSLTLFYEPYSNDLDPIPEANNFDKESYKRFLTTQVMLPQGDHYKSGTVIGHKQDANGNPIGCGHLNPILDSRVHDVKFLDGVVQSYAANIIAENLFSQVNDNRYTSVLMD